MQILNARNVLPFTRATAAALDGVPTPKLVQLDGLLLDCQSATGRISTGGSANVPGENGQLKSEILARVSVFGLEHTTLLRRQLAAYDAEARKIRGKKAKANFSDEVPTAQKSTLKPTTAKSAKPAPPTKTCDDEAFNHLNNADNDLFAMFAFSGKKIPAKPVESVGFLPSVKPLVPAEPFGMNMLSDQSSNTFGSSDFGWDDEAMTLDYTFVSFQTLSCQHMVSLLTCKVENQRE